ncbi:unnamed protein product [Mytilus coruscus]|uniref:Uncharacterized protein n=1 Tax=Mytilus coruscus TaxID=42192 RepID=A0A6J8DN26_MYTCO|nr:unnamed protein product [Mytilus coruscus]
MVNLEFNSSQFPSVKVSSIWRDAIAVCVITGFVCFILYQLLLQWRDEKDVETRFSYLESGSTCVHDRFQRASRMIVNEKVCYDMNVDFQTLRDNWTKEHSFTSRFDADVLNGKRHISEHGIHVQLTMAKGFVDRELRKIRKDMSEDILSLEEVDKDVSLLQKYFSK